MIIPWNDISFGVLMVAAAGICACIGFMLTSQLRLFTMVTKMSRVQAELAMEIERVRLEVNGGIATVPLPNWRSLPPEGQQMLRKALERVLTEMDVDGQVRH